MEVGITERSILVKFKWIRKVFINEIDDFVILEDFLLHFLIFIYCIRILKILLLSRRCLEISFWWEKRDKNERKIREKERNGRKMRKEREREKREKIQ